MIERPGSGLYSRRRGGWVVRGVQTQQRPTGFLSSEALCVDAELIGARPANAV